jgi:hypothetical protein
VVKDDDEAVSDSMSETDDIKEPYQMGSSVTMPLVWQKEGQGKWNRRGPPGRSKSLYTAKE